MVIGGGTEPVEAPQSGEESRAIKRHRSSSNIAEKSDIVDSS
jgi:hypothetical protein